jgi:hypothetical protein
MKKIIGLLGFAFLVLSSCSSDNDESSNLSNPILVKEIAVNDEGKIYINTNTYDGNKIKSITSQRGYVMNYTYTGDVITKTEDIDFQRGVTSVYEYTYKDGKLFSVLKSVVYDYYLKPQYENLKKYTHNEDGTVSYQFYKVNAVTGAEEGFGEISGKLTFKNGNIVREDWSDGSYIYEYDNKNSIYKNVLGFNLLLNTDSSPNNLLKSISIYNNYVNEPVIYQYEYNSDNYPVKLNAGVINGMTFPEVKYTY